MTTSSELFEYQPSIPMGISGDLSYLRTETSLPIYKLSALDGLTHTHISLEALHIVHLAF